MLWWISHDPVHWGITDADILTAKIPCRSYMCRLFQDPDRLLYPLITAEIHNLTQHLEALLVKKTTSCHALWQLDGQWITKRKLTRSLKKAGYKDKSISDFCSVDGNGVTLLYLLRAVDAGSGMMLGFVVLTLRANQLDIARFILSLFDEWGLPLELRVDLAGEHTAIQIFTILTQRLNVGVQYKTNLSAKLNSSVEVLHRDHAAQTAKIILNNNVIFCDVEGSTSRIIRVEDYAIAAINAADVHANRPMRKSGKNRLELLSTLPDCSRHVSHETLHRAFFLEWTKMVDRKNRELVFGEYIYSHHSLRFFYKVKIRIYPSYDGDRIEVRHITTGEVLFLCN